MLVVARLLRLLSRLVTRSRLVFTEQARFKWTRSRLFVQGTRTHLFGPIRHERATSTSNIYTLSSPWETLLTILLPRFSGLGIKFSNPSGDAESKILPRYYDD
jgi:hypothetical protein